MVYRVWSFHVLGFVQFKEVVGDMWGCTGMYCGEFGRGPKPAGPIWAVLTSGSKSGSPVCGNHQMLAASEGFTEHDKLWAPS